jgi:hypothetical protein
VDTLDLRIGGEYPFVVKNGSLLFKLETDAIDCLGHVLEFNPGRKETAPFVHDNGVKGRYDAELMDAAVVRVTGQFHRAMTPGNTLVLTKGMRYCPGVAILDSAQITVGDVTIYHCGGMGVVAQRTWDIDIERVRVTPNPSRDRVVSASADALHFVNCGGQIRIDDCVLENQMDDPLNIHGVYARISKRLSPNSVEVELVHPQQRGWAITQAGDTVEFVANQNLLTYHYAKVSSFERLNNQFFTLTVDGRLPDDMKAGDVVASCGWIPDATITRTSVGKNRARGFLLTTAGKVLVEDCHFHIPGAAILITGDANYWFESGKVRDVTIRNNHFDNCLYGVWGDAVIQIDPGIPTENREGVFYHKNIVVEGNRFESFDPRLLKARHVDGLTFRDNSVMRSDKYSPRAAEAPAINVEACTNVVIEGETALASSQNSSHLAQQATRTSSAGKNN